MAWPTPIRTWADNDLVTATLLNAELRDRMAALKTPPSARTVITTNQSIATTTFTDLLATPLTIQATGGTVLALFSGKFTLSATDRLQLRFVINGTPTSQLVDHTIVGGAHQNVHIHYRSALPSGARDINIQWRTNGGNSVTLDAANAAASFDVVELG
jgi:hypothetical protein